MRYLVPLQRGVVALSVGWAVVTTAGLASAQDDARTKQLRLLCAQLSGDLTDPGGMAAFRRCLTQDPLAEIRRDNNIAGEPPDRSNAAAPAGFGRNSRRLVAEGISRFQVTSSNLFHVVDRTGRLWRGTGDAKDARLLDQNVAAFQVIDGHLFVQSTEGALWRGSLDGSERTRIDQAVAAFQPINAGLIYVLGTDRRLWRELGDAGRRTEVDRAVKDFQAIDGSLVFVLGADQQLWREVGTMQSRTLVASQIMAFQYIPAADTIYVQTADATLWRKAGNGKPELVDRSVAAFQAVDFHLAYVLGRDGRLWRVLGERDQALLVDNDVLATSGTAAIQAADTAHVYLLGADNKLWAESMPAGR